MRSEIDECDTRQRRAGMCGRMERGTGFVAQERICSEELGGAGGRRLHETRSWNRRVKWRLPLRANEWDRLILRAS